MSWSLEEVAKHRDSSQVLDVTEFLSKHPGGPNIILKFAGRDATSAYEPIHPSDAIQKNLSPSQRLGTLKSEDVQKLDSEVKEPTKDEMRFQQAVKQRPPLNRILNLADMEDVAKQVLPHGAFAFFSAGTDDELTLRENARAFNRFFFHARVMRPVSKCDPSTKILGYSSSLPLFISGASTARLGHPEGELNITRGAGKANIIQMVCTYSSIPHATIAAAALPSQILFFQLYKNTDLASATKMVQEAERLGYKAIFLTRDVKSSWILEAEEGITQYYAEGDAEGATNFLGTSSLHVNRNNALDAHMSWQVTIPWLRSIIKLPIVLKGVQCVELLAAEAGVEGILLLRIDSSLPPLEVLYRIRQQRPDLFDKMEGPFAYGEAGVSKILHILHREISTSMRLLGAASISDLTPDLVERVDWEPVNRQSKL
ncbi:FMN-linked oxidoreductase [Gymnopus androsaceus JB14]|uniref:FMN-linked oxidoreductase n=1 Tax=Gymnopus androsaceus JB14 TaxID=1447944 RepID=A0A6A4IFE0_9AGAR|nr:FMN-linked oxidoreductase [Gymnopus androsaceus JB14]